MRTLQLAEEWQRMLNAGEAISQAELARKLGVATKVVSQNLALLKLEPGPLNPNAVPIKSAGLFLGKSELADRTIRSLRTNVAVVHRHAPAHS